MSGYSKLFSSIVTSSIWTESDSTVRVWIAMLATCNSEGVVEGAIPGFASLARVSVDDMIEAVRILSSPDQFSRSPEHEGRRIEVIRGGWKILNYESYRNSLQSKRGSAAERMRRYRENQKTLSLNTENTENTEDRRQKTEDKCIHSVTKRNALRSVEIPECLEKYPGFTVKWEEWLVYRKQLRKPMPPKTQSKQLNFLSRFKGDAAIKMIDQSIEKGWTGLFEVKNNQNKSL